VLQLNNPEEACAKALETTTHKVIFADSRDLSVVPDCSVDLLITSPPYPMIEMWDDAFSALNNQILGALKSDDGRNAFELMHQELDKVWQHCFRILKPGCIACINIGDAVRTIGGDFRIYSNHARILSAMDQLGFQPLPDILWRKPTNAPNKFMGSGMLPTGAYVTYEHEYILIFRKGKKREFNTPDLKARRRTSAYFWEERNVWFSDVWTDLKGTTQRLSDESGRKRSAAYPFELAYRLICMYSIYGDVVFDPFLGTGTTTAAAISAGRNSVGIESQKELHNSILESVTNSILAGRMRIKTRLSSHLDFIRERLAKGSSPKHYSPFNEFPVMTLQEEDLCLYVPDRVTQLTPNQFRVNYHSLNRRDISEPQQLNIFQK
jgi:DNA modification methylase